jgi:hypothetical protein
MGRSALTTGSGGEVGTARWNGARVRTRTANVAAAAALALSGCASGTDVPVIDPVAQPGTDRDDRQADEQPVDRSGTTEEDPADHPAPLDPELDPPVRPQAQVVTPDGTELCEVVAAFDTFARAEPAPGDIDRFFDEGASHFAAVAATVPDATTAEAAHAMADAFITLAEETRTAPAAVRSDEDALGDWLEANSATFGWVDGQFAAHGDWGLPDPDGHLDACTNHGNVPG